MLKEARLSKENPQVNGYRLKNDIEPRTVFTLDKHKEYVFVAIGHDKALLIGSPVRGLPSSPYDPIDHDLYMLNLAPEGLEDIGRVNKVNGVDRLTYSVMRLNDLFGIGRVKSHHHTSFNFETGQYAHQRFSLFSYEKNIGEPIVSKSWKI